MSEVNPLIAAILATGIIEPKPRKTAARRAVAAYLEVYSELAKVAPQPAATPGHPPTGSFGAERWPDRKAPARTARGPLAKRRPRKKQTKKTP